VSTGVKEISEWFDEGIRDEKSFMVITCDTFDHSDYPVYFDNPIQAKEHWNKPGNMQRNMEFYDLHRDKAEQLSRQRNYEFPWKHGSIEGQPMDIPIHTEIKVKIIDHNDVEISDKHSRIVFSENHFKKICDWYLNRKVGNERD